MIDLFQDLPAEHEFFERFSFISSDSLKDYQAAVRRGDAEGLDRIGQADRTLFVSLPFKLIPDRHRLGLLDDNVAQKLLRARQLFAEQLPAGLRGSIAFFDRNAYNPVATVMDNILFGKVVYGRPNGARDVGALVATVIEELGLRPLIINLGLNFHVGIGGGRLTVPQRQKISIARCLLKDADLLILDRAVSVLDPVTRAKVLRRISQPGCTAGVVLTADSLAEDREFPLRYVMEGGRIVDPPPKAAVATDDANFSP
jgi:ABC-type thiamine transport system ATPase subunit